MLRRWLFTGLLGASLLGGCQSPPNGPSDAVHGQAIESFGTYSFPGGKTLAVGRSNGKALLGYELRGGGRLLIDGSKAPEYGLVQRWRLVLDAKERLWVCSTDFQGGVWSLDEAGQYNWHSYSANKPFMVDEVPEAVASFGPYR